MNKLDIEEFLVLLKNEQLLIDVRSPSEFFQGHIPGAQNIALFDDNERKIVGTIYKEEGKTAAISRGLEIVGPKLYSFINQVEALDVQDTLSIYCWRGGKRSASVAWLFDLYGYQVSILNAGYKAFRRFVLNYFNESHFSFIVLGGKTGSGKTKILELIKQKGQQVIELERLAKHKGSAFGKIGESAQSSNEQFENDLFWNLFQIDLNKPIWLENESRTIGKVKLPDAFWHKIKLSNLIHLEVNKEIRIQHLMDIYSVEHVPALKDGFEKIRKRLGHLKTEMALKALDDKNLKLAAEIALEYYDKCYEYDFQHNPCPAKFVITIDQFDLAKITEELLKFAEENKIWKVEKKLN